MNPNSDTVQVSLADAMREHVATAIYLRLGYMETGTSMRRNDAIGMKQYDCIKKLDHDQQRLVVDLEDVAIHLRSRNPVQIPRNMIEHVRISVEVRLGHIETGTLMRAADAAVQNGTHSSSRFSHHETIPIRTLTPEQKQLVLDLEDVVKTLLQAQFPSMTGAHRVVAPTPASNGESEPAPPGRRGFKSVRGR